MTLEEIVNQYAWEMLPKSQDQAWLMSREHREELARCMCEMAGRIMALKKELGMGEYEPFKPKGGV